MQAGLGDAGNSFIKDITSNYCKASYIREQVMPCKQNDEVLATQQVMP